MATYDFGKDTNNYYANISLDRNTTSKNISVNLSNSLDLYTYLDRNIKFTFMFPAASYTETSTTNNQYRTITTAGWDGFSTTHKTDQNLSKSGTAYSLTLADFNTVNNTTSSGYYYNDVIIKCKGSFVPPATTLSLKLQPSIRYDYDSGGSFIPKYGNNCYMIKLSDSGNGQRQSFFESGTWTVAGPSTGISSPRINIRANGTTYSVFAGEYFRLSSYSKRREVCTPGGCFYVYDTYHTISINGTEYYDGSDSPYVYGYTMSNYTALYLYN